MVEREEQVCVELQSILFCWSLTESSSSSLEFAINIYKTTGRAKFRLYALLRRTAQDLLRRLLNPRLHPLLGKRLLRLLLFFLLPN